MGILELLGQSPKTEKGQGIIASLGQPPELEDIGGIKGLLAALKRADQYFSDNIGAAAANPLGLVKGAAKGFQDAVTLPREVYDGKIDPRSEEGIQRAADMAGTITLGAGAVPAEANSLRAGIKAYHGSPHDFDKFSLDKIGTGEGAQAYGHGLYFAENKGTADFYRQAITDHPKFQSAVFNEALARHGLQDLTHGRGTLHQMLGEMESEGIDAATAAKRAQWQNIELRSVDRDQLTRAFDDYKRNGLENKGHLYEVKLDANPEDFLNWDAKLGEQPQIADRYGKLDLPLIQAWAQNGALPHVKGETAYRQIAGGLTRGAAEQGLHAQASDTLRNAGIPGIRYLDQGSRGAGQGTSNYVVFDPSIIDILSRK